MKLFAVRLPNGDLVTAGDTGLPLYFATKPHAKAVRDRHEGAVVVLGPDHKRFNANK